MASAGRLRTLSSIGSAWNRGKIVGRHRSTGIARPHFWDRARYYGEEGRLAEALERAEARNEGAGL